MTKTNKLAKEILDYNAIKNECVKKYESFIAASDDTKRVMLHDKSLFYMCPADKDGKIRAIFFPKKLYDWILCASKDMTHHLMVIGDPTYTVFKEIYDMSGGHFA